MTAALIVLAVFAVLLTPFFLLLAILRFMPPEKRLRMLGAKPERGGKKHSPRLAALLEALSGLF